MNIKIGCLIMASGKGTRFGSNKLMADLNGKPLLSYAIDNTKDIFDSRTVITRYSEAAKLCSLMNINCIIHDFHDKNDVIRIGMESLANDISHCIFIQGDQPLIKPETLKAFAEAIKKEPDYIYQFSYNGEPSSPVCFPALFFNKLKNLPSGKSGKYILEKHPAQIKYIPAKDAYEVLDVDTPADIEKISNIIQQK